MDVNVVVVQGDKKIGSFAETTAHLYPRIDVGLYRDVALYAALPIVRRRGPARDNFLDG